MMMTVVVGQMFWGGVLSSASGSGRSNDDGRVVRVK